MLMFAPNSFKIRCHALMWNCMSSIMVPFISNTKALYLSKPVNCIVYFLCGCFLRCESYKCRYFTQSSKLIFIMGIGSEHCCDYEVIHIFTPLFPFAGIIPNL